MSRTKDDRRWVSVLRQHGANGSEIGELRDYTKISFDLPAGGEVGPYPLPDESCVAAWIGYSKQAAREGVFQCLRQRLVQLRFPIAAGMSRNPVYRAATHRGVLPPESSNYPGLILEEPATLQLVIQPTPAGRIPALIAPNRSDFESLLRALTRRNEPEPIPRSLGATIVAGYNNWDRIHRIKTTWQNQNAGGDWATEFREIVRRKHLYQDRFILLSAGPYSCVAAADVGLSTEEWLHTSMTLRLEHECTHYFTRRVFGSMRNSLHDELLADYFGIVAATGRFCAEWFLRFCGLEARGRYRQGGRMENYRGDPPLSDGAFAVLQSLIRSVARRLEAADSARPARQLSLVEKARALYTLASFRLEEMADRKSVV